MSVVKAANSVKQGPGRPVVATSVFAGFDKADDTYNAITCASDGKVYYVLSSLSIDKGGEIHVYDPVTGKVGFLGDLTTVCGEAGKKAIPQGKSHVRFYESHGRLYFATQPGYTEVVNDIATLPDHAPQGYNAYPGGHILSYDLSTKEFEDIAVAPDGQGIITMTMDVARGNIFAISWPKGDFIYYSTHSGAIKNLGPVSAKGEKGIPGDSYRVLCRSMFTDPATGHVYFSVSEGDIFTYHPALPAVQQIKGVSLRLDYFGKYDPAMPGTMAYNWRKIVWHPKSQAAYGIHGRSGYLFRFDPYVPSVEVIDRITSLPSRKSGMFDPFRYGYMGLQMGARDTLYYLTGGRVAQPVSAEENLHLITYDIPAGKYTDHGAVFYEDGSRPLFANSIAIAGGYIYTLARHEKAGNRSVRLLKIKDPLCNKDGLR